MLQNELGRSLKGIQSLKRLFLTPQVRSAQCLILGAVVNPFSLKLFNIDSGLNVKRRVDGMVALYEPDAVLDCGEGELLVGREAIRKFYSGLVATGRKFEYGEQQEAIISGDLALTSTRSTDGTVTAEVARRQSDGTWLWVIDRFSIM